MLTKPAFRKAGRCPPPTQEEGSPMHKICSWCQAEIGFNIELKGISHGICLKCLKKYFPKEAASIIEKMNRS